MNKEKFQKRFFDSTRGRIVTLMRGGAERSVDELAKELGLTDNAVRAHLSTLERDGLVKQGGIIKGFRKPHFAYALTEQAEELFPKPYDLLFNELISALKGRLSGKVLTGVLREVGRSIALAAPSDAAAARDMDERLNAALSTLEELGGKAALTRDGETAHIRSSSCPLATAVTSHPEVCKLAETLLAEVTGRPVKETCNREAGPKCHFEIALGK